MPPTAAQHSGFFKKHFHTLHLLYNKEFDWALSLVPGREALNLWSFSEIGVTSLFMSPSDQIRVYTDRDVSGWGLVGPRG